VLYCLPEPRKLLEAPHLMVVAQIRVESQINLTQRDCFRNVWSSTCMGDTEILNIKAPSVNRARGRRPRANRLRPQGES
jgi:hypothetical protein